ncbi:MAG: hypothetical protein A2V77_00705 [Anaeromyxobacter sp. RBG_16_69_14]|nr:MAG: hypothetical protein A2V77_00705 [Anaeromyxobacter sp. RBG_16_69_14]
MNCSLTHRSCSLKLAVLLVASLAGCARARITPTHGKAYSAVFAQQAPAKAKVTGPVSGLDSQEAAIISLSYRRGLASKETQPREEQQSILLLAPPSAQGGGYGAKLAPSVPSER